MARLGPPASPPAAAGAAAKDSPARTPAVQDEAHDAFSKAIVQIEPHLGAPALTLLYEYPISEAALAQRAQHDASVAERFETSY